MSRILRTPATYESVDGFLNVTLVMAESVFSADSFSMTTRTYNGTIPGPTLVVSAGDTINLHFINQLADQGLEYAHNEFSAPDETNIHFHGLHVSGEEPSDDATLVLGPGESYAYSTTLPANHLPGTHWIHPHRHGSTALQVGGGAAGAIIVRDPLESSLPSEYRDAREVLMIVQPIYHEQLTEIAQESGDALFTTDGTGVTMLVNGQEQPSIPAVAGEWLRLRVIYASWEEEHLDLSIPACTMKLIAKDGIYIPSVPRSIETANIISGARADIMVSCAQTSTSHELLDSLGNIIATIDTNSTSLVSHELPDWEVDYPAYLEDLSAATVLPQCSCPTYVGPDDGMNGFVFEYDHVLHYYKMGEVAERDISSRDHPYHQHVYPYQLIDGFDIRDGDANAYYQLGDWHDSIDGTGVIRHRPDVFDGKVMIHCHRLDHEDTGMMGIEWSADACECGEVVPPSLPVWAIAVIAVVALLLLVAIIVTVVLYTRKNTPCGVEGTNDCGSNDKTANSKDVEMTEQ